MKKIQKLKKGKFQKLLLATTMAIMTFANKVLPPPSTSETISVACTFYGNYDICK